MVYYNLSQWSGKLSLSLSILSLNLDLSAQINVPMPVYGLYTISMNSVYGLYKNFYEFWVHVCLFALG